MRINTEYDSFYRASLAWIGVTEFPPDYSSEKHSHESWEFIYIDKGHGVVTASRRRFAVQSGDMLVYPPKVEHAEQTSGDDPLSMKMLSVINTSDMDFLDFWPVGDTELIKITGSWLNGVCERVIKAMLGELRAMDVAYSVRINALCMEFLSYLAMYTEKRGENQNDNSPRAHVMRSKQYMETHYTQNITLTDIAADSYVSSYYLSHLFKEHTGYSPIHYLISLRMNKAQDLLAHTDLSITEISRQVGYDDLQYFSNIFKRHTSLSPRSYRNKAAAHLT